MTAAALITVYLVVLTTFLGLDIVSRVSPKLYGVVLAGMGALAAMVFIGAMQLAERAGGLAAVAAGLAGIGAGGGLVALVRLLPRRTREGR